MLLYVNTESARAYMVDEPLWNLIQTAYGSQMALKRERGAFSAFLKSQFRSQQWTLMEIRNRREVESMPISQISFEELRRGPGSRLEDNVAMPISPANGTMTTFNGSGAQLKDYESGQKSQAACGMSTLKSHGPTRRTGSKIEIIDSPAGARDMSASGMQTAVGAHKGDSECSASSSDDQMEKKYAPAVGMRNYGANCYLNAALQCLFCVPELNAYFLAGKFSNLSHATKKPRRTTCRSLADILGEIFSGQRGVVSPKAFLGMCPAGQQDAHEFLWKTLFPMVQEETNPETKGERKEGWNGDESWEWYRRHNTNVMDVLFGGQYRGTVKCRSCGHKSVTYDPFLGISLSITGDTVDDCLSNEYESEELGKRVGYRCEKCSEVAPVTKLMEIDRPPKYLILHLKRLVGGSKKINRFIKYPRQLDIAKYSLRLRVDTRRRGTRR